MRENRLSGSEGGAILQSSLPLSITGPYGTNLANNPLDSVCVPRSHARTDGHDSPM
jgi:hypothetical protein